MLSLCFVVWLCVLCLRVFQTKKRVPFSSSPMRKCGGLFLCLRLVDRVLGEREQRKKLWDFFWVKKGAQIFSRRVDRTIFLWPRLGHIFPNN